MPAKNHRIDESDIVAPEIYARERSERRRALIPVKRVRRIETEQQKIKLDFVSTEITLGFTFCDSARLSIQSDTC